MLQNYIKNKTVYCDYSFEKIDDSIYQQFKENVNEYHIDNCKKIISEYHSNNTIQMNKSRVKPICAYYLNGKFAKKYSSIKEATIQTDIQNISYALKHPNSKAGDYLWRYDNGDYSDIEPYSMNSFNVKSVEQIDKKTKRVLNKYPSMIAAEEKTGVGFKQIWKVCNHQAKTAGGYIWRYAEE